MDLSDEEERPDGMDLKEALRRAEERLAHAGIADAKTDAWLLLEHVTDITRAEYFLSPEKELSLRERERFFGLVEERAGHRPLQHITGTQDFMGLTFHVNEHVLIPRQDTEVLVEKAIEIMSGEFSGRKKKKSGIPEEEISGRRKKTATILKEEFSYEEKKMRGTLTGEPSADRINYRILDLCTGSGCIAVSLAVWALRNSWPVEITATDISEDALRVARANAEMILKEELRGKHKASGIGAWGKDAVTGTDARTRADAATGTDAWTRADAATGTDARAKADAVMEEDACAETDILKKADETEQRLVQFYRGDLFETAGGGKFSMILANPPYIREEEIKTLMPEVRDFEPRLALDGAGDGLAFYRRIAAEAPEHLEQGGRLLLEIGCDQACAVSELLAENGFCDIQVLKDYAGLDRVVCGRYEPA